MGIDISARALAARAIARSLPHLDDFGRPSAIDGEPTRLAFRDAFAAGARELALTKRCACRARISNRP
jgi:hypothetical protein